MYKPPGRVALRGAGVSVLAIAVLLSAGCADQLNRSSGTRTELRAQLNGLAENPPHGGPANGQLTGTYDSTTHALDWEVKYARLSGPPQSLSFIHPITSVHVPGGSRGTNTLTGVEATELTSGRDYVNIMTDRYPDGEVRGRVVHDPSLATAGLIGLRASLGGRGEEISNATSGKGAFTATFDPTTRVLDWQLLDTSLTGVPRGIQFTSPVTSTAIGTNGSKGTIKLSPAEEAALLAGRWAVEVDTAKAPGGEIGGTLRPI